MLRPALCLLLLAGPLLAQEPTKLVVTGGGVKTVVVVESVPFNVEAPKGAAFYFWVLPAGVEATDKGDVLEVTAAPGEGLLSFGVKYVTADWEAKKFITSFDKVAVFAGSIGPAPTPVPVDPEAVPSAVLKKAIADAYALESDPNKADYATKFAQLLKSITPILKESGRVKTAKNFYDEVHNTTNVALKPAGPAAIPTIRQAAGAFIQTRVPRESSAPVDETYWRSIATAHSQVAQAILAAVKGAK